MSEPILLDTCAAIWLMNGDPTSEDSRAAIRNARRAGLSIFVSPITAGEIGTLVRKHRIRLTLGPEQWFDTLLALPGIQLAPMPPKVLIASNFLPGNAPKIRRIASSPQPAVNSVIASLPGTAS